MHVRTNIHIYVYNTYIHSPVVHLGLSGGGDSRPWQGGKRGRARIVASQVPPSSHVQSRPPPPTTQGMLQQKLADERSPMPETTVSKPPFEAPATSYSGLILDLVEDA